MRHSYTSNSKNKIWPYVAFLILVPILIVAAAHLILPQFDQTYLYGLQPKLERLESCQKHKIVVIGGSSVPFSLDGQLIEEACPDYEYVDFGLYLNLGTTVMYDLSEQYIKEGDIVIICPEQSAYALSMNYSPEDLLQATDGNLLLAWRINPSKYEKLVAAYPSFAFSKVKYLLEGKPIPDSIYSIDSFNEYGDICAARVGNIMPGGLDTNVVIGFNEDIISDEFIDYTNEYARRLVGKGAKVYYHFSPMNALALDSDVTEATIKEYYKYLDGQLLFPILGNPNQCIMDAGWFYDTNFHLNSAGAICYTKLFIDDLKTAWGDTSTTAIALPDMPEIICQEFFGDDSMAELFVYKATDNGLIITAFKENETIPADIILPTHFEGKAIIDYDPNLFVGNTSISTVTFQPNLGLIKDNTFAGCSKLDGIKLVSPSPADYSVGDELFSGFTFNIYVPDTAVSLYKTDYDFKKYDSYIKGK